MEASTRRLTTRYSKLTAVAAMATRIVPTLDELIVVPMHYRLVRRVATERGVPTKSLPWTQLRRIIWYGAAARLVGNISIGIVPVVGMFTNAITAVALTEYLGRYLDEVIANPTHEAPEVTYESLKDLFASAMKDHQQRRASGTTSVARA